MSFFITEYPQFFTASLEGWYKLPEPDQYKDVIMSSLRFLVENYHAGPGLAFFSIIPSNQLTRITPLIF